VTFFGQKNGHVASLRPSRSFDGSANRQGGAGGGAQAGGGGTEGGSGGDTAASSTGEACCATLFRCVAVLATRDYSIASSIFSSFLTPSRQKYHTKVASRRVVAPLLAARARGRGGVHGVEEIGGSPQALALIERIMDLLDRDAKDVVKSHLDEYLDGLALQDEEAMITILTFFKKWRFLGRFFLQKGTARVSEAAMNSYKHLSTSLQILLEAAQHFSRGGVYNHCLTSLELAALLKQRMAKLHSATAIHRSGGRSSSSSTPGRNSRR